MITGFIIGWLLADFLSGLFHWWEDRIGFVDTPILGPQVVYWNRIHHRNPRASLKGSFWYRNRDPIIATLTLSILWLVLTGPSWVWLGTTLGGLVSTQVHYWTHHPIANKTIAALQETGLIQSPAHHRRHHAGDQDIHYCVLTNFLNPVLDALGFWLVCERLIVRAGLRISLGKE